MDEKPKFVLPERNPKTHAAHRKEVWWQITLPLVIGCLLMMLVMAGVIWSAAGANPELRRWADISFVWLILPVLFFALLALGVVGGITYLVSKLLGALPGYARLAQDGIATVGQKVGKATDALVAPLFKLKSWRAAARRARQVAAEQLLPQRQPEE